MRMGVKTRLKTSPNDSLIATIPLLLLLLLLWLLFIVSSTGLLDYVDVDGVRAKALVAVVVAAAECTRITNRHKQQGRWLGVGGG